MPAEREGGDSQAHRVVEEAAAGVAGRAEQDLPPLKGSRAQAAAEAESKVPKRLSQVRRSDRSQRR